MKKLLLASVVFLLGSNFSKAQLLFSESFSSGMLPSGWTNDSSGMPALNLWLFDNPYNRNITGVGFDADFAIFDSDEGGDDDGIQEDAQLTTPIIPLAGASGTLWLEFDEQFHTLGPPSGATRRVMMSTNGGSSFTTINSSTFEIGFPNPAEHSIYDISTALGNSNVMIRFDFENGDFDYWWAIDNVQVISRQTCVNPVNAGSAVSTMNSVCPGDTFYLTLSGADYATNLTYQWQSSTDNMNWNDMVGDTTDAAYAAQTGVTYYRCGLTCGGTTSYSNSIQITLNSPTSCYCVGEFVDGCDILDNVEFNTLSNLSSDCNGLANNYINYPDTGTLTTSVHADSTYDLTIASGFGSGDHSAGAWFDWNKDGDFQDPGEFFLISDTIPEYSNDFTISITVPNHAVGATRMRVRYIYDNPCTQISDCEDYGWGETEDYTINVINPTAGVPDISRGNIKVYPVPASDNLVVESEYKSSTIRVFEITGRLALSVSATSGRTEIAVSELPRGMYMLVIDSGKEQVLRKITLQ